VFLVAGKARGHVGCPFTGTVGPDPVGGQIQLIEIN
jgi:hypothetical protein